MANESIGCTVLNCKHHAGDKNYCSLPQIQVSSNGHADCSECTDCASFECC